MVRAGWVTCFAAAILAGCAKGPEWSPVPKTGLSPGQKAALVIAADAGPEPVNHSDHGLVSV